MSDKKQVADVTGPGELSAIASAVEAPRRGFLRMAAAGAGLALMGGGLLTACGGGGDAGTVDGRAKPLTSDGTETCGTTTWTLTAGQTIPVGTVTVSNDATNLYITYAIDTVNHADCTFGTLHAWVGNDIQNVPANPQGTPVPGKFPHVSGDDGLPSSDGTQSYTFTIPFSDLNIVDVANACPLNLYVVTHAEVNCGAEKETAFGGPIEGSGPRWWFYGSYAVCCAFGPPPIELCQTAFAKGGHVFTTDKRSNPEALPSLSLSRNRWGWAINLAAPGDSSYDIWAGAGLNKTSNGTKVGTLSVDWDGTTAAVTYEMSGTCTLKEVHLYAGDSSPTTIAPGQYGNLEYFDPKASTHTFNVALADTDGAGGVWLIAHAVVCCS